MALLLGCSSDDGPPHWAGDGTPWGGAPVGGPCREGNEVVCGKTISQSNGVVACLEGKQYCVDGRWSECQGDDISYRPDPTADAYRNFFRGRLKTSAFLPPESEPIPCDNPCDPYCYFFDEDPEDITAPGGPIGLPEFPGGPPIQACDHDLCTTGSALYETCSPCATQVCAAEPSCCTTAWTSSCVQLAYSLCTNQRPPMSLCDFGLFSDTSLSVRNRSTADAVIGAYGNITIEADGAVAGVYSKGNITYNSLNNSPVVAPHGIVADGNITTQASDSMIYAFLEAGGNIFIPAWDVQEHVYAGGSITGQSSTTILGDARANSGITDVIYVGGTNCGSAGCYEYKPLSLPPQNAGSAIPSLPVDCTGTMDFNGNGGTVTVNGPGVYRDVNVINNGTLVLEGEGVYYFRNFVISSRLVFRRTADNTGAGWDIRTCGNTIQINNGTQFRGETAGGVTPELALDPTNDVLMDPSLVTFYAQTSSLIEIGTDVYMTGIFIAPNARVTKKNMNSPPTKADILAGNRSAPVNGAIWARQLELDTDAYVKQIPKEACEDLGIPGTTPPGGMCPIVNVTPPVPPAINEPCSSGLDCQMNHSCVGPETGAACAHSKCMPGAPLNATCDDCVARICAEDPSCCSASWSPSCVAKVATVCDAVCESYGCYVDNLCTAQPGPMDASCSPCVASICAVDPSCCTTAWTQACADRVFTTCSSGQPTAPTPSICDYAASAAGTASVGGAAVGQNARVLGGNVGGRGLGSMSLSYAEIDGNVFNAGAVATYYATITKNLVYGSGTNSIGAGTTYGALLFGNPTQPPRPTRSLNCPGGANVTATSTLAPGNYGTVTIPNGSTLTLAAGTYTFQSLTIGAPGGNAGSYGTLALPATGQVTLNVCGDVRFYDFARVTGVSAADALNLDVYAGGNVRLDPNATVYGLLNSNTSISVFAGATLYGMAWSGGALSVSGNGATIDARGLAEACRSNFDPNSGPLRIDRLCGYSAYGASGVVTSTNTRIDGGALGSGATLTAADGSRYTRDVLAIGDIDKASAAEFFESVRSRGAITGTSPVFGTETPGASAAAVPAVDFPNVSFPCVGGKPPGGVDENFWGGNLTPGTYGNVTVMGDWQTINLQAGDYYVGNFDLSRSNLTLGLPANGTVRIFACGRVSFGPSLNVTNNPTGANVRRLQIYSLSDASANATPAIYVNVGSGRSLNGVLVAPNGKISVGANATVNGVAWGNEIWTASGATINASGFAGSVCEAANVDAPSTCPASITPDVPDEPAECRHNPLGYTDATCPTYDLAADVPCGAIVPVCNHGSGTFNGDLTIGYWAAESGQMSREHPTRSPEGTCVATGVSIAPGNCIEVPCSVPSGLHSLVVDPDDVLVECAAGAYDRRLDNWTVHDGRTCSGAGNLAVEYLYEAECPLGSSARWGFLTWDTDTPGTSSITFSAQVAFTEESLTGSGYTEVGVARSTPADTSVCTLAGPSPHCPIKLSDALGLGVNQGQYLALRIALQPTADTPTLRDWQVTYTCAFDE